MSDLSPRNISAVRAGTATMQEVGECISDIVNSHNYVAQQTNASPVGVTPAPLPPTAINVTGGAGIIHATVNDSNKGYKGNEYHFEVVPAGGNFETHAHPISTGPARAVRTMLGPGKYDVRACTGYSTSSPSPWVYAKGVDATGSNPPEFPPTTGSGIGPGGGYGSLPWQGPVAPKRA